SAWVSDRRNAQKDIFTMHPDGTHIQRVTYSEGPEWMPSWSPDNSTIVFGYHDGQDWEGAIASPGQGRTTVTNNEGVDDLGGDWAPGGSKIVFWTNRDGDYEIFTIQPDRTHTRRVTTNDFNDYYPFYEPDGSRLYLNRFLH